MGRGAKHFTQAEKQAAKRSREHIASQDPRARWIRKLQNQRAYQRRLANTSSAYSTTFNIPELPLQILQDSGFTLPSSHTYTIVRESGDFFTDSDLSDESLARFDRLPPYPLPQDDTNIGSLQDAICGRRMRCLYESETLRLDGYKEMKRGDFFRQVHQELNKCLQEWEETRAALQPLSGQSRSVHCRLGKGWEQWLAKRVMDLKDDLYAIKHGRDSFMKLYIDRWS